MAVAGNEKRFEPRFVTLAQPLKALGYSVRTSAKTVFRDIPAVLKKYLDYKNRCGIPNLLHPWVYLSVSRNYNEETVSWDYVTGYAVSEVGSVPEGLIEFEVPAGEYIVFEVRARVRLALGHKIAATKDYVIKRWFPSSCYETANFDIEYNDTNLPARRGVDL